jgi:hypothetical protein
MGCILKYNGIHRSLVTSEQATKQVTMVNPDNNENPFRPEGDPKYQTRPHEVLPARQRGRYA